jgi:hypothetical protein
MQILPVISTLVIIIQLLFGLYKKSWGLGLFIFIFLVFPSDMPHIEVLNLNIVRSSIIICLVTLFIKDNPFTTILYNLKVDKKLVVIILLFSILLLPSFTLARYSPSIMNGFYMFVIYFLDNFIPGIIIIFFIRNVQEQKIIFKWIIAAIIFLTIYGLIEYFLSKNIFIDLLKDYYKHSDHQIFESLDQTRLGFTKYIQSTHWHSIAYGGLLSLLLPFVFLPIISKKLRFQLKYSPLFLTFTLSLLLSNIFLTLSRSAWISSFIICFYFLLFYYYYMNGINRYIFFTILFPILIFSIFIILKKLLHIDFEGSSVESRIQAFKSIIPIMSGSLAIGYGPNSILELINDQTLPEALGFESVLLSYPISYGLLGVIALLIIYRYSFITMNTGKNSTLIKTFNIVLIAHITFIILTGDMGTLRYFWFVFSFLFVMMKNKKLAIKRSYIS